MSNRRYFFFSIMTGILLTLLSACNMPGRTTPTSDPGTLYTIAAQTVQAQMTQDASAGQAPATVEPTPQASATQAAQQPGEQPVPSATQTQITPDDQTQLPSNTPAPSPTPTQIPCDQMQFISDVTIEDGTELEPGEPFVKTWRIKNTGSCTWTSGYSLVFDSGDAMGSPASVQLTTGTVAPGQEMDVSVNLVAPDEPGDYKGYFRLRNPGGILFGFGNESKSFWVDITVPEKSGVMFDFLARADEAKWGSGVTPVNFATPGHITLTYGGPDTDSNGFAMIKDDRIMENGLSSAKVLETHPKWEINGYIVGRYPEYKVGTGDRIQGRVGFLAKNDGSCGLGNAVFSIYYTVGTDLATLANLGSWTEVCDGTMTELNVDLTALKGKTVRFYLVVLANGDSTQDWAIWSSVGVFR